MKPMTSSISNSLGYSSFDLTNSKDLLFGNRLESDTFKSALIIVTEHGTIDLRMTYEQLDDLKKYLGTVIKK